MTRLMKKPEAKSGAICNGVKGIVLGFKCESGLGREIWGERSSAKKEKEDITRRDSHAGGEKRYLLPESQKKKLGRGAA